MGSLRFNVGVGDAGFQRGMARIEQSATKTASVVERAFKLEIVKRGVEGALRLAGKAIDRYTEKFPGAKHVVEEFENSLDPLAIGVGRDLVAAMESGGGIIRTFAESLNSAREGAVDLLSDLIRGDWGNSAAIREQQKLQEELDKTTAALKKQKEERDKAISAARAFRDEAFKNLQRSAEDAIDPENSAVRAIRRKYEEALTRMDELTKGMSQSDQVTSGLFGFRQQLAGFEYAEVNKALADQGRQRRQARNKDSESRTALGQRGQQLEDQIAELRIETLRNKNQVELADLLQNELNFRQRIREVTQDTTLSERQRAAAVGALNEALDAQRAADRAGPASRPLGTRGIDAAVLGQGGTRQGQFFGGMRGQDPGEQRAARVETLQKQAVDILKTISEKLPANGAAVGPTLLYEE